MTDFCYEKSIRVKCFIECEIKLNHHRHHRHHRQQQRQRHTHTRTHADNRELQLKSVPMALKKAQPLELFCFWLERKFVHTHQTETQRVHRKFDWNDEIQRASNCNGKQIPFERKIFSFQDYPAGCPSRSGHGMLLTIGFDTFIFII